MASAMNPNGDAFAWKRNQPAASLPFLSLSLVLCHCNSPGVRREKAPSWIRAPALAFQAPAEKKKDGRAAVPSLSLSLSVSLNVM